MNSYKSTDPGRGKRLLLSTLAALAVAIVILITVVLPAEYGLDPTGAGKLLGLTEMGQIKTQLAREAASEKAGLSTAPPVATPAPQSPTTAKVSMEDISQPEPAPPASAQWQDSRNIILTPGQGVEVKLVMDMDARAEYEWEANGSRLNCDTHGDNASQKINYKKVRGKEGDRGEIRAAFTGNHGWFWRNRTAEDVTLTLRVRGDYQAVKRIK
ncbi:MAG: transmembrane anchor protein [Desulfobacterales bacterium]|nr:transmembrane anchor protein [Desulfobacterales bacterium]